MDTVASYLMLDGTRLRASGEGLEAPYPSTSVAVAVFGEHRQEFTGCRMRGFGVTVANEVAGIQLDQTYSLGTNTTLRIGEHISPVDGQNHLAAVWEGKTSEVYSFTSGLSVSELVGTFDAFHIEEQDLGVVMRPRNPGIVGFPSVSSVIDELHPLGIVEMERRNEMTESRLPNWSGASVAGGELFGDRLGSRERSYVIVGETTHTTVVPGPELTDSEVQTLLERLVIETVE